MTVDEIVWISAILGGAWVAGFAAAYKWKKFRDGVLNASKFTS